MKTTAEGEIILRRLPGKDWFSLYTPGKNDIQGSPQLLVMNLGETLSGAMGIDVLDDTIKIVHPELVGAGIRGYNGTGKYGPDFLVSFYAWRGMVPHRIYLRRFAEKAQHPLSSVHDVSFHVYCFLMTPAILAHAQRQVALGLKFLEYLEAQRKSKDLVGAVEEALSDELDALTGTYFSPHQNEEIQTRLSLSPLDFVKNALRRIKRDLSISQEEINASLGKFILEKTLLSGSEWMYAGFSSNDFVKEVRARKLGLSRLIQKN